MKSPSRLISANDFLYHECLAEIRRQSRRGDAAWIRAIEATARAAWFFHPGRLADGRLENPLLEIGQRAWSSEPGETHAWRPPAASTTLHIATELYATGGHSRALARWVMRDTSSRHIVVLTRQQALVPPDLVARWREYEVKVVVLDAMAPALDRARDVRRLASAVHRVVLHHNPDDAVPILAFSRAGGPPVAMFNHAHFWFSLGASVSDLVVNTAPYFEQVTQRFRHPKMTTVLDGPPGLDPIAADSVDKGAAKAALQIDVRQPVVMSIGNAHYFTPKGDVDFFRTASRMLADHPDVVLLVVGVPEDWAHLHVSARHHPRIRLLGPIEDPRPFYRASDVCLESYPMPSLGGLIEAIAYGEAFPVLSYSPVQSIIRPPFPSLPGRAQNETQYLATISAALADLPASRARAAQLRMGVVQTDVDFAKQFAPLYECVDAFAHQPHPLPATSSAREPDNLLLAEVGGQDIGRGIADAMGGIHAIRAHLRAARFGHESVLSAARNATGTLTRLWRRP